MPTKKESPSRRDQKNQNEVPVTILDNIIERRAVPGVLSFDAKGTLLYMNAEADLLNQQILGGSISNGTSPKAVLPPEILDMCLDLQQEMALHSSPQDFEKIELRRVTGDLNFPVLLRGFLLPDLQGNGDASLLILMEKIGRQTRIIPTQTAERFRLTEREQEIVKYIADGRTNKEIAQSLSISEHTVKEHVRHLLKKTKTSTRTAVLAQVYQDS